ncbi:MAG: signal recognition particle-docking protein FtsY [Syntrophaceae bacterium]|nr:signal recognition particle-docking protein FtsY [Syntrophaceae bacterium]
MSEEKKKKAGFFSRLFRKDRFEEVGPEASSVSDEVEPQIEDVPEKIEVPEIEPETPVSEIKDEDDSQENLERLQTGLTKTRKGFLKSLDEALLGKREIDEETISRLEEVLVRADVGVKTTYQLLDSVSDRVKRKELDDPDKILLHLKEMVRETLLEVESPLRVGYGSEPFVIMVLGVNGSGKTTTIAKIAARQKLANRKVMMVAGDTFRAAAVEQLTIWADRIGCDVIRGKEKADPSSVVFEAMERAIREDYEIVLIDTAGRLHTRIPLMEELKKVSRTIGKKLPGAPHETLLVIDSSMGQNAILQARTFNEAIPVTGLALTKLDGTAKGGIIIGISNELKIPIRYIGIGEKIDDLRDFNARQFAEALFSKDNSLDNFDY